jgi:hypothetical protein
MTTIDGVGSYTSQSSVLARLQRGADSVRAQGSNDTDHDQDAKTIVNAKGVSLYDARKDIMAQVKDAMSKVAPGQDPKAAFQKAMDQALQDNGFDPAKIKSQMATHHHGKHGHHQQATAAQDPSSTNPDQMMQSLLSKLPTGATVNTTV